MKRSLAIVCAVGALWAHAFAPPVSAQDAQIVRGSYYRTKSLGFEMWIPSGYERNDAKKDDYVAAQFLGGTFGGSLIAFATHKATSGQQLRDHLASQGATRFKKVPFREVDGFTLGGRPVIVRLVGFGSVPFGKLKTDILYVGFPAGGGYRLFSMTVPATRSQDALAEVRWMLTTVRPYGPAGLDLVLGPQRLHVPSGVLFRIPRRFEARTPVDGPVFLEATSSAARLTARIADETSADTALRAVSAGKPHLGPWIFPHPARFRSPGRVDVAAKKCHVTTAMQLDDSTVLVVKASGRTAARERLIRLVEDVCAGVGVIDVEELRETVRTAVAGLAKALEAGDADDVETHVDALCGATYFEDARLAMANSIVALPDEAVQCRAIDALAVAEFDDVGKLIVSALGDRRVRSRTAVMGALLEAAGATAGSRAKSVLLKYARHKDAKLAARAIRGMGRLHGSRAAMVKRLGQMMRKAEKASKGSGADRRERWESLRGAYREALRSLTGGVVESWEQARSWKPAR